MTTQALIDELKASLGNRTDITDARYVNFLNWAQYDLCGFHRKRQFPSVRFRQLENKTTMTITPVAGTAQAGDDDTITLASGSSTTNDYYNDRIIKIVDYTGAAPDGLLNQVRVIADYAGTLIATVDEDWDTNPDSSTDYEIYQWEIDIATALALDPTERIWAIERLETLRGTEIEKKDWEELIYTDYTNAIGEPSEYARRGNSLILDAAIEDETTYRVWYYAYPTLLLTTTPTVEPVIPEAWHEVIVLGAIWRGFERLMEPDRANTARKLYIDEALNRIDQYAIEEEHIERGMKARSYVVQL